MEAEYPLSSLEKGYKHLYQTGRPIDMILTQKNYDRFFSEFGEVDENFYQEHLNFAMHTPIWKEDAVMREDGDIFVMRYPRYLPPYTHSHQWFELYYVKAKGVTQVVEQTPVTLDEGDLLIMSPGVKHSFSIMNDEGIAFLMGIRQTTFSEAFTPLFNTDDILSEFFIQPISNTSPIPYLLFSTKEDQKIEDIISAMIGEADYNTPYANIMMNLYFEQLCVLLMRAHKEELLFCEVSGKMPTGKNMAILKILHYIFRRYQTVTLSEIAKHFNYSEAHLCRVIKSATGKTFAEIRTAVKIKNSAKLLISNQSASIEDVSLLTGYSDLSTYYKTFKGIMGVTPAEYRREKTEQPL